MRQPHSPHCIAMPLLLAASLPMLGGCVVRTAANVATAPVRAASWTADKATTSQSEADRNRGRAMRKQEKRDARERRREEREREASYGGY